MNTDYIVAEVELSYRNRVPYKDRKKVVTSEDAYNILLNNHDDDTIDYTETFKVLYLNHAGQVVGCKTLSTVESLPLVLMSEILCKQLY